MMRAEARHDFANRPVPSSALQSWPAESRPMTAAQAEHLLMLCEGTDQVLDDSLTRGEAARLIAFLEQCKAVRRSRARADI